MSTEQEGSRERPAWLVVATSAGLTVALAATAFLARSDDETAVATDAAPTTTSSPATTTTSSPATTVTPITTSEAPATTGPTARGVPWSFEELPIEPGLSCRELADRGIGFDVAMLYWYREGGPNRMDADADGVPCATVYDRAVIDAYWSEDHPEVAVMNVARRMDRCGYAVTALVDVEVLPDGTHDVTVSVDLAGDGVADLDAAFNVYTGFDVFPIGDEEVGAALLDCSY